MRLSEPGGRAISETASVPVAAGEARFGIKPLFDNGRVAESSEAGFEIIAVDGAGARVDTGALQWELLRVRQRYQWYSRYGRWDYEPVTYTERVASGTAEAGADGAPARIAAPVERGRYRLELSRAGGDAKALPVASYTFSAGWYVAEAADYAGYSRTRARPRKLPPRRHHAGAARYAHGRQGHRQHRVG